MGGEETRGKVMIRRRRKRRWWGISRGACRRGKRVLRGGGNETEKPETSTGKREGKVMNTRGKNGQKLEKRNEKPVNGKKGECREWCVMS